MAKDLVGAPRPRDGDALELERLRRMYGDTYRVWRTPRYWMATAVVEHLEPTLMEESAGGWSTSSGSLRAVWPGRWRRCESAGAAVAV